MICDPCKQGIHTGSYLWPAPPNSIRNARGAMVITGAPVCKGGTWCDCQHRQTMERVPQ
jgi:hypothetical protein